MKWSKKRWVINLKCSKRAKKSINFDVKWSKKKRCVINLNCPQNETCRDTRDNTNGTSLSVKRQFWSSELAWFYEKRMLNIRGSKLIKYNGFSQPISIRYRTLVCVFFAILLKNIRCRRSLALSEYFVRKYILQFWQEKCSWNDVHFFFFHITKGKSLCEQSFLRKKVKEILAFSPNNRRRRAELHFMSPDKIRFVCYCSFLNKICQLSCPVIKMWHGTFSFNPVSCS